MILIMKLCLEVYNEIFEYCNIYDQLNVISTCKLLNKKLKIKKLNHLNVSDEVLQQEKFIDLEELDANENKKIKNVNHLTKLKILSCSGNCGINQIGIKNLRLIEELTANNNEKIKNKKC